MNSQTAPRPAVRLLVVAVALALTFAAGGGGAAAAQARRCAEPPTETIEDVAVSSLASDRGIGTGAAEQRLRAQYMSDELAARVRRATGADFGGLWVATANDDRITVGVVRRQGAADLSGAVRRLAAECGIGDVTDVVDVSFSMADLKQGIEWLAGEVARVNEGAPAPLGAALIPSRNAVVLRLPADGSLTTAQQALVDRAQQRYGTMLRLEETPVRPRPLACDYSWDACDPPLRAGVAAYIGGWDLCTYAFLARSRSDNKLYIMTAGHCVRDAFGGVDTRGQTWQAMQPRYGVSLHDVGRPHSSYFDSRGDAALVNVNNPSGWAPRAWVWVRPSADTQRNEAYRIAADGTQDDVEGKRLCHTGLTTGSDCGTVTGIYVSVRYYRESDDAPYPFTMTSMMESSACAQAGDSGGPHYAYGVAYGITSGGAEGNGRCYTFIQSITQAENILNVNVSHER
jgi:hypothetical protein